MRVTLLLLALGVAAGAADFKNPPQRIVGGSATRIEDYPFAAVILITMSGSNFREVCGGSVINNRSILTSATCTFENIFLTWRVRLGSTNANSGGIIFNTAQVITHPSYNRLIYDNDISILRVSSVISFNNQIQPGRIAGPNYNLADNQPVWAIGWGVTSVGQSLSESLQHVQIWTINHNLCKDIYRREYRTVTDNMLCSGWLDVGGRGFCKGDNGSPLIHNNVIVGVSSWRYGCASARYPGVDARVSRFTQWIQNNA